MKDLIEALEKILERGIVVEPVTIGRGVLTRTFRIRLADPEKDDEPQTTQSMKGW